MTLARSYDIVPHRVIPAMLKKPAAIRCKLSRPLLSFDVVPHCTGHCNNASRRRSPLQVGNITPEGRPLAANKKAATSYVRKATPFLSAAQQNCHSGRAVAGDQHHHSRARSQESTPPRRGRRQWHRYRSSSRTRVFTQRPKRSKGVTPEWRPQRGERCPRTPPPQGFLPEHQPPLCTTARTTRRSSNTTTTAKPEGRLRRHLHATLPKLHSFVVPTGVTICVARRHRTRPPRRPTIGVAIETKLL
jgi:hypothetical protein